MICHTIYGLLENKTDKVLSIKSATAGSWAEAIKALVIDNPGDNLIAAGVSLDLLHPVGRKTYTSYKWRHIDFTL